LRLSSDLGQFPSFISSVYHYFITAVPILYSFTLPLLASAKLCWYMKKAVIHAVRKEITEGDSEFKQVAFSSSLEIGAHFSLTMRDSNLSYFFNTPLGGSSKVLGVWVYITHAKKMYIGALWTALQQEFPCTLGSV